MSFELNSFAWILFDNGAIVFKYSSYIEQILSEFQIFKDIEVV